MGRCIGCFITGTIISSSSEGEAEWTATTRPGLCLSQDGRNWARVEGEHHTGALFDVGEEEAWDASGVRDPKVLLAGPNDIRVYYGSVDAKTEVVRRRGDDARRIRVRQTRGERHTRPGTERIVR